MNGVVVDLAFDRGNVVYAVIFAGQLLPVRFAKPREARDHLSGLTADATEPPRPTSLRMVQEALAP